VEIIGINSVIAGAGLPARISQPPSQPSPPQSVGATGAPATSDTDEARATGQETSTSAVSQEQAVQESVDKLNEFISPYVTSLQFSVDKDLGKVVVKIMDNETKEVIKQIPSKEILALTKALSKVSGLFLKQEA